MEIVAPRRGVLEDPISSGTVKFEFMFPSEMNSFSALSAPTSLRGGIGTFSTFSEYFGEAAFQTLGGRKLEQLIGKFRVRGKILSLPVAIDFIFTREWEIQN